MVEEILDKIHSCIPTSRLTLYLLTGHISLTKLERERINNLLLLTLTHVKNIFFKNQDFEFTINPIAQQIAINTIAQQIAIKAIAQQFTINPIAQQIDVLIKRQNISISFLYLPIAHCLLAIINQGPEPLFEKRKIRAFTLLYDALAKVITQNLSRQNLNIPINMVDKIESTISPVIESKNPKQQKSAARILQLYCLYLCYITPDLRNSQTRKKIKVPGNISPYSQEDTLIALQVLTRKVNKIPFPLTANLRAMLLYVHSLLDNSPKRKLLNIIKLAQTIDPHWIISYIQTGNLKNKPSEILKTQLLGQAIAASLPQIKSTRITDFIPTINDYCHPIEVLGLSLVLLHAQSIQIKLATDKSTLDQTCDFIRLFCEAINLFFVPFETKFNIGYLNKQCYIFREHMSRFLKLALDNMGPTDPHLAKLYFDYWRLCIITITPGLHCSNFALELLPHFSAGLAKQEREDGMYCVYRYSVGEIMSVLAYSETIKTEQYFAPMFSEYVEATTTQMLEEIRIATQQSYAIFDIPAKPPTLQDLILLINTSIDIDELIYFLSTRSFRKKNYWKQLLRNFINILYMTIWYLNAYIYPNRFNRTEDFKKAGLSIENDAQLTSAVLANHLQTAQQADIFFITIISTTTISILYNVDKDPPQNLTATADTFTQGCFTYLYSQQEKRYPERTSILKGEELERQVAYRKSDINIILLETLREMTLDTNTMETLCRNYIFYLYTTTKALQHEEVRPANIIPPITIESVSTRPNDEEVKETIDELAKLILEVEQLPQVRHFAGTLLNILHKICTAAKTKAPDWFKRSSTTYATYQLDIFYIPMDTNF